MSNSTTPPTTTPLSACPEVPSGGCEICGPDKCVAEPDNIFEFEDWNLSCGQMEDAGLGGHIPLDTCEQLLPGLVDHRCGCKDPNSVATRPPTRPPSTPPTPPPTQAPSITSKTPFPTTLARETISTGLDAGGIIGIVVGAVVGIVIIGGVIYLANRYQSRKEQEPPDYEDGKDISDNVLA
mmetsp:Transcript_20087/g.30203  ORF Transcript_20087/g.30203 Transcript_20087/m.30203 type:complete len:181 (+) Transcript_20087:316-858(+)|eukprot:CAMPEP_0178915380 /NCGR_PEP_ID=MMETSP0786-20121207/11994_1 /TAXON_ID=186022 /ORGANISM="Thalassionema frauenfeldii, Strain CCMP 1798" /LENGTH=180 /DNA_ID=CAMNT_0020588483 /DNA_START=280 /DNA_END=822 /DNA_ORIENTATION=+